MRNEKIVQKFGEHFVALIFENLGYSVDVIDAEGIDLMCYSECVSYGVSVKTRNIQQNSNNSINLTWNDIVYSYEQTKLRSGEDVLYAFVISDLERISVFIFTQQYMFEHYFVKKKIKNIDEYMGAFTNKPNKKDKATGSTQGIDNGDRAKSKWKQLYENKVDGIIFAAAYDNK